MPKRKRSDWKAIAAEAQQHRDSSLLAVEPPIPNIPSPIPRNIFSTIRASLSENEVIITELPPETLLDRLRTRELTAVEVTSAYLRRAAVAQKLTNCLTELLATRALSTAQRLDAHIAATGTPIGPLHGLPISVKEQLGMEGLRLSAGYCAWWEKTASADARVLKILARAGAVFHARTTEPQSMMHLETESNLYGATVNPYDTRLSAGGSSGGEGALVGARGSCLGIGTDIGGSIRVPASHCGIYGLKPTAFRIPTDGWSSTAPGADTLPAVIGPLSTSIAGLKLFMATILSSCPWQHEPALLPLPWNETYTLPPPTPTKPLRIALMPHDGVVLPHPPITRALRAVEAKLRALSNVEIVPWRPHAHDEAWAIASSLYYPDGGAADMAVMDATGEPLLPLTKWMLEANPCVRRLSMPQLEYWLEEREAFRSEYAAVWNATATAVEEGTGVLRGAVDVLLCPAAPHVAPRSGSSRYWAYSCVWNLLDWPAVVFPVCRVDKAVDGVVERERGKGQWMSGEDERNWGLWNPDTFHGLPVSLQLVARRCEDEKLIAVLEYIVRDIGLPFENFP